MAKHSNETYLLAIRTNDAKVLRDLHGDFFPSIRRYVINNSGTEEDAKDIFMDVLEALLRKVKQEELVLTCKLNTFLTEIGARLWLKKLRRNKFDAGVTTDDPVVLKFVAALETHVEKTEEFKLYREKFRHLDRGCRQVLQLGIVENKSHDEITTITGHSYDYSRKIRSKCLKKLISLIKGDVRFNELNIGSDHSL